MKVGVIGCGVISGVYFTNLVNNFDNIELIACADIVFEKALEAQKKHGIKKVYTVEELLADSEIETIVNLTIPQAHYSINKQIIEAGKNVYCEKPLALNVAEADELLALAKENGVLIGVAPDTIGGPGIQTSKKHIDDGSIGSPIGFTANFMSPGHDGWHPAPEFYYKKGAGPMMDMGPYYLSALVSLLGPIKEINCYAKTTYSTRQIQGKSVDVEVYTHYCGIVKLVSGVVGTVTMSFDTWHSELPLLEIYGTEGMLSVPDPNEFSPKGSILLKKDVVEAAESADSFPEKIVTYAHSDVRRNYVKELDNIYDGGKNMRGLGVSQMAEYLAKGGEGMDFLANGDVGRHVVEALTGFDISAKEGKAYRMRSSCTVPPAIDLQTIFWNGVEFKF